MKKKESLLKNLQKLKRMPLSPHQGEFLAEIEERLYSDKLFVAVVGEFKRGKSTFINAILGSSILPTGVLPLTNIVTLLEDGPDPCLEVFFRDRAHLVAPLEELQEFVAEERNPENRKKVRFVRVRFPSAFLEKGIVLVDTPGFESLHETQTEEARAFLPRIDIGLFLLSADSPLSGKEMALLDELAEHAATCLVLLNKTDFLSESEKEAMVGYVRQRITERHPKLGEAVFAISARQGLLASGRGGGGSGDVGGIGKVLSFIEGLVREKGAHIQARSNATRILSIVRALSARLKVEADSLQQPMRVLQDRIARFTLGLDRLEGQRTEAEVLVDREIEKIILDLDAEMGVLRKDMPVTIREDLRAEVPLLSGKPVPEFSDHLRKLAEERLKVRFEERLPAIEAKIESSYLAAVEKHRLRLTDILKDLLRLGSEVFSLDLEAWELPEEFSAEKRFFYLEGETRPFFDLEGAAVGFLERILPRRTAQSRILDRVMERVPERVDGNCGRVRFDLLRRLKDSAARFEGHLSRLMTESARGIEEAARSALGARASAEAEWTGRREALEASLAELEAIEEGLLSLLEEKD